MRIQWGAGFSIDPSGVFQTAILAGLAKGRNMSQDELWVIGEKTSRMKRDMGMTTAARDCEKAGCNSAKQKDVMAITGK